MNISDFLGHGAENAIPAVTLAAMKRNFEERLKALEDSLTAQDPVAIVEPVPGGYLLKTGEQKGKIVTMDELNKRYDVVIIDDVPRIKESE